MDFLTRFAVVCAATMIAVPAAADYEGPDGYGTAGYEQDVSHDGYVREGEPSEAPDPTTYVVIEAEEGQTEQVDGETVIVVQEPEPIAATDTHRHRHRPSWSNNPSRNVPGRSGSTGTGTTATGSTSGWMATASSSA